MLITPGNGRKFETDSRTFNDRRIFITTTPTGYYKIDVDGPGDKPKFFDAIYTNLRSARIALDEYVFRNEARSLKEKIKREAADRHKIKKDDAKS